MFYDKNEAILGRQICAYFKISCFELIKIVIHFTETIAYHNKSHKKGEAGCLSLLQGKEIRKEEREMGARERDGGGERGMLKMEFDTLKQAYNYNITYHFLFTTILPLFLIIK